MPTWWGIDTAMGVGPTKTYVLSRITIKITFYVKCFPVALYKPKSLLVSKKLRYYAFTNPTLTVPCYRLTVVELGEGWVRSWLDTNILPPTLTNCIRGLIETILNEQNGLYLICSGVKRVKSLCPALFKTRFWAGFSHDALTPALFPSVSLFILSLSNQQTMP